MKKKLVTAVALSASLMFTSLAGAALPWMGAVSTVYADEEDFGEEENELPLGLGDYDPEEISSITGIDTFAEWLSKYYFETLADILEGDESKLSPDAREAARNLKSNLPEFMYETTAESITQMSGVVEELSQDKNALYGWMTAMSLIYVAKPDLLRYDAFQEYIDEKAKDLTDSDREKVLKVINKLREDIGESMMMPIPIRAENLGFTGDGLKKNDLFEMYTLFTFNNPQFYFYASDNYYVNGEDGSITLFVPTLLNVFNTTYGIEKPLTQEGVELADSADMDSEINKAISEIKTMVRKDRNSGDWVTARCVHDWIIKHIDYDYAGFTNVRYEVAQNSRYADYLQTCGLKNENGKLIINNGIYQTDENYSFSQGIFSVFGRRIIDDTHYPIFCNDRETEATLSMRKDRLNDQIEYYSVCAGYSEAFTLLSRMLGLECYTVTSSNHAWNMMRFGDDLLQVDVTWDDLGGYAEYGIHPTNLEYEFFGVCADDDFVKDHDYTKGEMMPIYNYYADDIVTSWDSDEDYMIPSPHYYLKSDAPKYDECYFGVTKNERISLYGPLTPIDISKKNIDHETTKTKYTNLSENSYKQKGVMRVYDTPNYLKHEDKIKEKSITPSSNTTNTTSYSSSTTTSSSTKSGGGGGSSSSDKNIFTVGKGTAKAGYSKTGKKGKKSAVLEYPEGKWNIKSFVVPDTVKIKKKTFTVTKVAANAFSGYEKLEQVTIGKNVKKIGKRAFDGAKKMKTLVITGDKLTAKSVKNAFKGAKIKTVYVPKEALKTYQAIFTKKNTGNKVAFTLKAIEDATTKK